MPLYDAADQRRITFLTQRIARLMSHEATGQWRTTSCEAENHGAGRPTAHQISIASLLMAR